MKNEITNVVDILAIGVHPDDVELSCSGTLLKHKDQGKKIAILDLTSGELGTRGNPTLRREEALKAASILGVDERIILDLPDGFITDDRPSLLKIIEVIRYFRPQIVLTNAISDRHPDHGKASKITSDACFLSGLMKIQTFRNNIEQKPWRPSAIYHYIQDRRHEADLIIDITPYFKTKMESIMAYNSQFYDPLSVEPTTPISSPDFLAYIEAHARIEGRKIGVTFGEGFTIERVIGINSFFDII